jgi:hypothetical protein
MLVSSVKNSTNLTVVIKLKFKNKISAFCLIMMIIYIAKKYYLRFYNVCLEIIFRTVSD